MAAPDLTEPIIGFRAWHASQDGHLVPWSAGVAGAWARGVNTARCLVKPHVRSHVAPMRRCSCGLYALANPRDPRLHADGQVVGAIVAWGDIEVHATGFRAQSALIVALGLPDPCGVAQRERLRRASERYGVPLVPMAALPAAAGEYGRPVHWEHLPASEPRRLPGAAPPGLDELGVIGVAPHHHLEFEVVASGVRIALTRELTADVRGRPFIVPEPGMEIRQDDLLAQAESDEGSLSLATPLSGRVAAIADAHDPRHQLLDLVPTAWSDEAKAITWGPDARRSYATDVAHAAPRRDPFLECRTTWLHAHAHVRSAGQALEALRALRNAPRFASEHQVYEQIADRLRTVLQDQTVVRRVRHMPVRVSWRLHDPDADILIDLTGKTPVVTCGVHDGADLVVFASAEMADRYFSGRVDMAAALRRREIQCSAPVAALLRVESVLKALKPAYAALVQSRGAWARPRNEQDA